MRRAISMLLTVGVLGGFAVLTAASAHSSKVRTVHVATTISREGTMDLGGGRFLASGQLSVSKAPGVCRLFRNVLLLAHYPDGTQRYLDSGAVSQRGAWALKGDATGADRFKVKASRETVETARVGPSGYGPHHKSRNHRRRVICESASVVWRAA